MKRRGFIGASSTAFLAGCGGQQGQDTDGSPNNETAAIDEDGASQTDGDAEIVITNDQWINDGSAVEFYVENNGSTPSGGITVSFDWYDEDGNYIEDNSVSMWSLRDGGRWIAGIEPTTRFEAESYEISTEYEPGRSFDPGSVNVIEHQLLEEERAITGRIENPTDTEASISMSASVYDNSWLSHVGSTSESGVPPGDTWRFYFDLGRVDRTVSEPGDELDFVVTSSV